MNLEYPLTVKRSKRKTASIYIERDGSVTIQVPEQTTDDEVQEILAQNEYKIHKYEAKRILLNEKAVNREAVNGQSFLYLGRNYYLRFDENVSKLELKDRHFLAPVGSENNIKELFTAFYKQKGWKFIAPRLVKYAEMMGVKVNYFTIMDLKNRWASCSVKQPKINFNWKIMMAPVSVIEYMIVHELAHFKHKRHDAAFWNEVDKILPDYQRLVRWLKENGASMNL